VSLFHTKEFWIVALILVALIVALHLSHREIAKREREAMRRHVNRERDNSASN